MRADIGLEVSDADTSQLPVWVCTGVVVPDVHLFQHSETCVAGHDKAIDRGAFECPWLQEMAWPALAASAVYFDADIGGRTWKLKKYNKSIKIAI